MNKWMNVFEEEHFSDMPHKGLKSLKRFTDLSLVSMSSIFNHMGLMHSYVSPRVPQTQRNYNALIEFFKLIWDVKNPIHITIILRLRFVNLFVKVSRVYALSILVNCSSRHLGRHLNKITVALIMISLQVYPNTTHCEYIACKMIFVV